MTMLFRWNGFGGKVDPEETPLKAAIRELEVIISVFDSVLVI